MDLEYNPNSFPKICGCCGHSYDVSEWQKLRFVGFQGSYHGSHPLELRLCTCGTSLAVIVRRIP